MALPTLTYTDFNSRKSGNDRRNRAGISIRLLVGAGKRESVRRLGDRGRIFFVDWYSPKLFVAILAGIFLSIVDGFLTLLLMSRGAYEVNPIMTYALSVSPSAFVASKYILTCISVLWLYALVRYGTARRPARCLDRRC